MDFFEPGTTLEYTKLEDAFRFIVFDAEDSFVGGFLDCGGQMS